jgi:hypothetical protein
MERKQGSKQRSEKTPPNNTISSIIRSDEPVATEKKNYASICAPILAAIERAQEILKNGVDGKELNRDWLESHGFKRAVMPWLPHVTAYDRNPTEGQFSIESLSKNLQLMDFGRGIGCLLCLNDHPLVKKIALYDSGKVTLAMINEYDFIRNKTIKKVTLEIDPTVVRPEFLKYGYQVEAYKSEWQTSHDKEDMLLIKKNGVEVGTIHQGGFYSDLAHINELIVLIFSSLGGIKQSERIALEDAQEKK